MNAPSSIDAIETSELSLANFILFPYVGIGVGRI